MYPQKSQREVVSPSLIPFLLLQSTNPGTSAPPKTRPAPPGSTRLRRLRDAEARRLLGRGGALAAAAALLLQRGAKDEEQRGLRRRPLGSTRPPPYAAAR